MIELCNDFCFIDIAVFAITAFFAVLGFGRSFGFVPFSETMTFGRHGCLCYKDFTANGTMLTFGKTAFRTGGFYCFINYNSMTKCGNHLLRYCNFTASGAFFTLGKTCGCAGGSDCTQSDLFPSVMTMIKLCNDFYFIDITVFAITAFFAVLSFGRSFGFVPFSEVMTRCVHIMINIRISAGASIRCITILRTRRFCDDFCVFMLMHQNGNDFFYCFFAIFASISTNAGGFFGRFFGNNTVIPRMSRCRNQFLWCKDFSANSTMITFGKAASRAGRFYRFVNFPRVVGYRDITGGCKSSVYTGDGNNGCAGCFCKDESVFGNFCNRCIADGPVDVSIESIFWHYRCCQLTFFVYVKIQIGFIKNDIFCMDNLLNARIPTGIVIRRKCFKVRSSAVDIGRNCPDIRKIISFISRLEFALLTVHKCACITSGCRIGGISPYLEKFTGFNAALCIQRACVITILNNISVIGNSGDSFQISIAIGNRG